MLYTLFSLSFLFVIIGMIMTEKTAPYLLSGYNSLTGESRAKIDIKSYLKYFRKFHLFLGVSLLVMGLAAQYLINSTSSGIVTIVYPVLAYLYFMVKTRTFLRDQFKTWIGIFVVCLTLGFMTFVLGMGLHKDKLVIEGSGIYIEGFYNERLLPAEIASIELIDRLPPIAMRTDGFALGDVRKGFFKASDDVVVKLILNSSELPCILITKKSGEKIYYASGEGSNQKLFDQINKAFPQIIREK